MKSAVDHHVMTILIHSSKAMRAATGHGRSLTTPLLQDKAQELAGYLKTLSVEQLTKVMTISSALAGKGLSVRLQR